ncbi:TrbC/VirB2 family protein [Acidiphilium angustum]|uniref:TrbC/VirB2 family protein n=1 Tax=Acidiphilium angustum TaxID=523 RepID=UPI0004940C7B|nr:TrbC/VirB2 family protein [Acidiphilium angustum]
MSNIPTELRARIQACATENLAVALATAQRINRYRPAVLLATALLVPAIAQAQVVTGGTSPTTILSNIATFILGPFGETIAVLALIGIGVAFMTGRAGIGLIGGVVGGLVLIFGSSYLVTQFVGSGA